MTPAQLLVATRSAHKLAEIRRILGRSVGERVTLVDLDYAGVPIDPAEDDIEVFDTFRDNALAKARHFAKRTGLPTLADDSGIVVPALGGAPGVRSKRFSGRDDLDGARLDAANNERLLERLADVDDALRQAHYVCAAVLVRPGTLTLTALGTCAGRILRAPEGSGGFGYDPLFYLPALGRTFGHVDAATKSRISHRGVAFRALAAAI